jgi:hypothetical protein
VTNPIKRKAPNSNKEKAPLTDEAWCKEQVEAICGLYQRIAELDVTELSFKQLEDYRQKLDQIRYVRVALESDRPYAQKREDFHIQMARYQF